MKIVDWFLEAGRRLDNKALGTPEEQRARIELAKRQARKDRLNTIDDLIDTYKARERMWQDRFESRGCPRCGHSYHTMRCTTMSFDAVRCHCLTSNPSRSEKIYGISDEIETGFEEEPPPWERQPYVIHELPELQWQ